MSEMYKKKAVSILNFEAVFYFHSILGIFLFFKKG